ncbi:MAG: DUF4230 domain-containing protein [Bacteroidia bacterium]|nr:DUF4230 domain-containing protein [Bacteroidia bacterium]NNJ55422.1 DUF4230 domain-containing protein [Bacteroidia bacterium]
MKKIKLTIITIAAILAIIICVFIYYSLSNTNVMLSTVFIFAALSIIVFSAFLLLKDIFIAKRTEKIATHTMVDSLKRVFKVVTAEGHYTEIIDFEHSKVALPLLSSTKKALIIVKAKVLMGYDFEKLEWEGDEKFKTFRLKKVPEPSIVSISPEITYYNLENGIFNKFNNEDLNKIQSECIEVIQKNAMESDLPKLAAKQVSLLLTELTSLQGWTLEGQNLLEQDVG